MGNQRQRVLVIDPDQATCDLYQRTLGATFDLLACNGSGEGLGVLAAGAVDAVVLEPHHPHDVDWKLARILAEQSGALHIPLLIFSAVEVDLPERLGAAAYLLKPVSPTIILSLLRQLTADAAHPLPHPGATSAPGSRDTKESPL